MKVGILYSKTAEVNGTKPKSLRTGREMPHRQQKSRAMEDPYSALQVLLWVFSATILRPLTSARNYATIADRKGKFRGQYGISKEKQRLFQIRKGNTQPKLFACDK